MTLSAAELASINQGSIDAANKANAAAGITSAAPAGSSFIDPTTNKPATSGTGAAPLMVSSNSSRSQYADNVNTLNQATGQGMPSATAPGQSTKAQLGNTVGAAPTPAPGTTINIHPPGATDQGGKLPTSDPANAGRPGYDVFGNPVASNTSPTDTDTSAATSNSSFDLIDPTAKAFLQQNITDLTTQATQAKAQVDAATATMNNDPAMIAAAKMIKDRYDQLIAAMVDHNKIVIGGATVNSARTGGMQYAPDMNALFMNDAMQRAQQRVTDLKNEEEDLIFKSNEAYKSNNVRALNDAIANYNTVSSNRMTAVRELLKAASDAASDAKAQVKDAQAREDAVTTKINDVVADASKNGASPSVLAKISMARTVQDAIVAAGDSLMTATGDPGAYLFAKRQAEAAGVVAPNYETWQANLDKQKLDSKIAELRATEGIKFNYAIALEKAKSQLASAPNPDYHGEFAATIKLASQAGTTNTQRSGIASDMQDFIASGDYQSAYAQIDQSTMNILKGSAATTFQEQQNSLGVLDALHSAMTAYAAAGGNTNIFKGKVDQVQNKIGALMTDPKYASLAVQMNAAFQNYRLQMTGAAFGDKESAEYASILPAAGNTLNLNLTKLQGAKDYLNSSVNTSIKNAVGQGGVFIKEYAEAGTKTQQQQQDVQARMATFRAASPKNEELVTELHTAFPSLTINEIADRLHI